MTNQIDPNFFYPVETIAADEIRITALGTGMPFARRRQASPAWLVELGNRDVFIFDLGTGSSSDRFTYMTTHTLSPPSYI